MRSRACLGWFVAGTLFTPAAFGLGAIINFELQAWLERRHRPLFPPQEWLSLPFEPHIHMPDIEDPDRLR